MPQKMRVVNNGDYNKLLKERGKVFGIMHSILISNANNQIKLGKGEPKYSNLFIKTMYAVGYILGLRLRQLCGFFEDYAKSNNINIDIPDFTTLSRRLKSMDINVVDKRPKYAYNQEIDISIDSTTISIYANTSHHDKQNAKYRKYFRYDQTRKMHVSIDENNKNINAFLFTKGTYKDHLAFPALINSITKYEVNSVKADRAYDYQLSYQSCYQNNIEPIIPPKRTAAYRNGEIFRYRNQALMTIKNVGSYDDGLPVWKNNKNYGKRSCVETFFSRFKNIFGFSMRNKCEPNRKNELLIKCNILNEFNRSGLPRFELVN